MDEEIKENSKILIVRLSAIGDVVHTIPILHSLKSKYPNSNISWVVEDKAAALLEAHPLIDKLFVMPKQKWKKQGLTLTTLKEIFAFISSIKKENFDIAIDIQQLFKSAIIMFLSGAKRKIAHDKTREFAHLFANEKLNAHNTFDPNKMIIERYLEPAKYLGCDVKDIKFSLPPVSEETTNYVDELLIEMDPNKPIIIFSPATIWPTKHWVEEYWAELLDMLCEDYSIIFTGAPNDKELVERIVSKSQTKDYLSLIGKTNIKQLIEVFNRADIVIAPDTGPAHIANATDTPSIITIFGSTSYKRSAPYGNKHIALSAELPCQPCFKRKCTKDTNKMQCVKEITPNKVFEIIRNLI